MANRRALSVVPLHVEAVHTFAGSRVDRAAHLRSDEAEMQRLLESPGCRVLPFKDLRPLLADGDRLEPAWIPPHRVRAAAGSDLVFLGLRDGAGLFAARVDAHPASDHDRGASRFVALRAAAPRLDPEDASVLALGRSLLAWNASHRFCPRCGAAAASSHGGHQRRCEDPACGVSQFPRTDPVVIMLIHLGDRCLLGRSIRTPPYPPGLHSCLAGYVEPGESIEEAVRREALEEAGAEIGQVRYHSSQPWPFPSALMIGCFAEALGDTTRPDPAELESLRWFTRAEIANGIRRWDEEGTLRLPPPFTIAHQLARAWLAGAQPGTS